jgi:CRISPR-associated endonuclease/helicase Cas3
VLKDTPSYFRYWGKAEKDGTGYHLLPYHCLDVAAVGQTLLENNPFLLRRMSELSGIEETTLKKILIFYLATHDLGKYSEPFQFLIPALFNRLQGKSKSQKQPYSRKVFCHGSIGFLLWKEVVFTQAIEEMVRWGGTSNADDCWDIFKWFLEASNGHHGLPVKQGNKLLDDYFAESDQQSAIDFINDLKKLFSIEDLRNIDLDENYDRLYRQLAESSWLLAGFNVLCDWIGSGEVFEYLSEEKTLHQYWYDAALKEAEIAVKNTGILPCKSNNELDPLTELLDLPENARLTPLQDLVQRITLLDKPQLFIIEDETGAGKTEACLIILNRLMAKGLANGFYLGLPTMATADGIYPRIQKAYNNFYLSDQKPSLVLAHSSAKISDRFTETIVYQDLEHGVLEQPYEDDAQSICQAWLADNRKKALLAHVGVGTIDQAFLAVLKTKYQSLRLIGLLGKVLVIDEAHAYDAYMGKELEVLLRIHASLGGSAIIMSATLPSSVRQNLSDAFLSGLNTMPFVLDKTDAYPLLTHIGDEYKKEIAFSCKQRKKKKTVRIKFVHSENEIYELIRKSVKKEQCACWIRNSVRDARETYQTLKDKGVQVDLFHARFTMIDRSYIQSKVMKAFDKNSRHEQRKSKVVIATQVVEQSLDLDFDVMITDLAPIDLILQRTGRMHRHIRDKLSNPKTDGSDERGLATLYVFTPEYIDNPPPDWFSAFFPNAKKVYENHAKLWLSLKCLQALPKNRLSGNIRGLIESVYGSGAEVPEGLRESDINTSGNESSGRTMGSFNTINFEAGYTIDGQVWEDDARVPTRLGEETVIITLAQWEGGRLVPFTPTDKQPWQQNEIRVLKKNIDGVQLSGELRTVVNEVKQLMPGKGKWTNVLPMVWDARKDLWAADVVDGKHYESKVYYCSEKGLIYGYEFDPISNEDQLEKDELI